MLVASCWAHDAGMMAGDTDEESEVMADEMRMTMGGNDTIVPVPYEARTWASYIGTSRSDCC